MVEIEAGTGIRLLALQNRINLAHCEFLVAKLVLAHADFMTSPINESISSRFTLSAGRTTT